MTWLSRRRETCRLCGSSSVALAVPLAPIPAVTPNVGQADEADLRVTVPLDLYLCRDCGHLQLFDIINPDVQYNNFRYTTSVSLGLGAHFDRLAEDVIEQLDAPQGALVVEIGSNDGSLLKAFQRRGLAVLGIDPARQIAEAASAAGVPTLATFFTAERAAEIRAEHGPADIILSNNTLANLDDLDDVVTGIRHLLKPAGVFIFETQYGADVIRHRLIDTIYHEHLSYFLVAPLQRFFSRHGLELIDVQPIVTKGGSIRCSVRRTGSGQVPSDRLVALIAEERAQGLNRLETYQAFTREIEGVATTLAGLLDQARATGARVAGYGASVGSLTLLHRFGLTGLLKAVADDNPLTEALVGPDYHIPVVSPGWIYANGIDQVLILAWRYSDPILARHQLFLDRGGKFIIPLPEPRIIGRGI
ncbi:MAG: class I SAM-dependent methyltransferase [Azospirillaceae bacterium]|nr:class I SAM-dependent methyltransferase [Azospirillaceae bacterium]